MKVGILGTGFGAYHAELYKDNAMIDEIRIWGRDGGKAAGIAANLGISQATDIKKILEDPEIGLVDICLPNALHRETIVQALQLGKQVYCETPVCLSAADADALLDAERRLGGKVYVNQFIKFFPEYSYIKQAITENKYGKLLSIDVYRKTPPIWGVLDKETIATNLMIHDLDFVTWILGEPAAVAVSSASKKNGECKVDACLKYDGITALVTASSMMPMSFPFTAGFHAIFENGAVDFNGEFPDGPPIKNTMLYLPERKEKLELNQANPYEAAIAHVVDCCQNGKESILGLADAAAAIKLACKIREML